MRYQKITLITVIIALSLSYAYAAGGIPSAPTQPNRKDEAQKTQDIMIANLNTKIERIDREEIKVVERAEYQKEKAFKIQEDAEAKLEALEEKKSQYLALANRIRASDPVIGSEPVVPQRQPNTNKSARVSNPPTGN